jgi:hypothetical protein
MKDIFFRGTFLQVSALGYCVCILLFELLRDCNEIVHDDVVPEGARAQLGRVSFEGVEDGSSDVNVDVSPILGGVGIPLSIV